MKKITLKNFKCFEFQEVEFKNLTVLSGINGSGKSTVIHSLLLLLQSNQPYYSLVLNGYFLEAGVAKNILYHNAKEDIVSFVLEFDKGSVEFNYIVDEANTKILYKDKEIKKIKKEMNNFIPLQDPSFMQYYYEYFLNKFIDFISADRYGPRLQYPINNINKNIGKLGEFAPYIIGEYKDKIIENKEIYFNKYVNKKIRDSSLLSEINNWLSYILDGVRINTKTLEEVNISLLEITNYPSSILDFTSPVHMPYGASYILPIIVSCLMASFEENSIVIIENPESHLHPSAQSKLGEFFAVCANAGIQIILETHSDHIINGIRKAVKNDIVSNDEVIFNFFSKGDNLGEHKLHKIEINKDAQLSHWPKDFFDQYENDLMDLI